MNIAIVGGRDFSDYNLLKKTILDSGIEIKQIISGGASGADSLACKFAQEFKIPIIEFIPDWDKYGKSAGYKRNIDIITAADWVFSFWDYKSKGTKLSIDISRQLKKPLEIIKY
jgi:hypothetical protein